MSYNFSSRRNNRNNDVEMRGRSSTNNGGDDVGDGGSNDNEQFDCKQFFCQGNRGTIWGVSGCCCCVGILLMIILIPISFSYVEWNKLALKKNTITNIVDRSEVFPNGRYYWGVNTEPLEFPSVYQLIGFRDKDLMVFAGGGDDNNTAAAGLEFGIECDVYYRLSSEKLGDIFNDFGTKYHDRFVDAIRASLKNTAPEFSVDDYVSDRQRIAVRMRDELNNDLLPLHIQIEPHKLLLLKIKFPDRVLTKFQDTVMKNLEIDQSILDRDVDLYKKGTEEQVQAIQANITVVTQTAEASASAIVLEAEAASVRIHQEALGAGINGLMRRLNITDTATRSKVFQMYTILDNPSSERVLVGDEKGFLNVG